MPEFVITGPDGKKYKVTGANAQGALDALKRQIGAQPAPVIGQAPASSAGATPDIFGEARLAKRDRDAKRVETEYNNLPDWAKPIVTADDLLTQFASGVGMGLPEKAAAYGRSWWNGTDYATERGDIDKKLADSRERSGLAGAVANIAGSVAGPAALAKAGVTATNIPRIGKLLGLTADGAAIGATTAYGNDQDVGTGALIGGGLGAAGQALVGAGAKVLSPFMPNAERSAAAEILSRNGVPVSAGQRSGSQALRYAESEIGGGAAENFMEKQGKKFTAAVLNRIGEKADSATPEVIDRAFSRIGKTFDDLAARNAMVPDQQIAADLAQTAVDYASLVAPSQRISLIDKTATDVLTLLQSGRMDGKVYKTLRSNLDRFARGTSQPEAKTAARELIQALDGGMERSIARTNPADAGAWSKVRNEYRNILAVEEAMAGAGENSAAGIVSPAKLRSATVRKHGKRNYVRGKGDFAELARAGETVLAPLPNSGTAARLASRGLFAAIGGGAGYGQDGWTGLAKGALLGGAAPWVAGRMLMSKPVQAYLGNKAASSLTPEARALIARMLATGGVGLLGSTNE